MVILWRPPHRPPLRLFRSEWHYFDLSRATGKADLVNLSHVYDLQGLPHPVRQEHVRTMWVDLAADEATLWSRLTKGCRYDVRRAENDGVLCDFTAAPGEADIGAFLAAADDLYRRKKWKVFDFSFYEACAGRGELLIGRSHRDGAPLNFHVYLKRGALALLLNSVSLLDEKSAAQRQLTGRANRLNHWRDMLALKEMGRQRLDLGTYAAQGHEDRPECQSLKAFKLEFGALETDAWYVTLALTRKGRLVHALKQLKASRQN